jgi:hypothetical protein
MTYDIYNYDYEIWRDYDTLDMKYDCDVAWFWHVFIIWTYHYDIWDMQFVWHMMMTLWLVILTYDFNYGVQDNGPLEGAITLLGWLGFVPNWLTMNKSGMWL